MSFQAFGQDSFCSTTEAEQDIRSKHPELGSLEDLYIWYKTEIKKLKEDDIEDEFDI